MLERFTVIGMPVAADARRSAGRPRDPQVDAAIRAATLELLVEDGYQATTIQAVARRAGVSAPSIYRRGGGQAAAVAGAVVSRRPGGTAPRPGRESDGEEG